jgi:hypothetical protein
MHCITLMLIFVEVNVQAGSLTMKIFKVQKPASLEIRGAFLF